MRKAIVLAITLAFSLTGQQLSAQNEVKKTDSRKTTVKTTESNQPSAKPSESTTVKSNSTKVTVKSASKTDVNTSTATKPPQSQPSAKPDARQNPEQETKSGLTSQKTAAEGMKVYNVQGNVSATIGNDGTIRDHLGRLMGKYTESGEYFNAAGEKVGYIENSIIRKEDGKEFARIGKDGRVYNGNGEYMGTIADDGTVINNKGVRLGSAPGADKGVAALIFFFPKQTPLWDSAPPEPK